MHFYEIDGHVPQLKLLLINPGLLLINMPSVS